MKDNIVKEINLVVDAMKENNDPFKKLYFFSGIHGLINKVFNMEYDPELVWIHHVLSAVHAGFLQRMNAIQQGDQVIVLDELYFEKLIALCKALKDKIAKSDNVDDTLKKFIVLLYATTGNGYYLKHKGLLKI